MWIGFIYKPWSNSYSITCESCFRYVDIPPHPNPTNQIFLLLVRIGFLLYTQNKWTKRNKMKLNMTKPKHLFFFLVQSLKIRRSWWKSMRGEHDGPMSRCRRREIFPCSQVLSWKLIQPKIIYIHYLLIFSVLVTERHLVSILLKTKTCLFISALFFFNSFTQDCFPFLTLNALILFIFCT